jgi:hypothetical protein
MPKGYVVLRCIPFSRPIAKACVRDVGGKVKKGCLNSVHIGRDLKHHHLKHHQMYRFGIPYFRCEPGSSASPIVDDPPIRSERRALASFSTRIAVTGVVGSPIR